LRKAAHWAAFLKHKNQKKYRYEVTVCPRSVTACGHLFLAQIEKETAAVEVVPLHKKSRHKRLFSCLSQNYVYRYLSKKIVPLFPN
jgi:hypothetical protein